MTPLYPRSNSLDPLQFTDPDHEMPAPRRQNPVDQIANIVYIASTHAAVCEGFDNTDAHKGVHAQRISPQPVTCGDVLDTDYPHCQTWHGSLAHRCITCSPAGGHLARPGWTAR
jgi:hypothetical protein